MTGTREISPKTVTNNATTISMVEKAGNTFSAGDNRACSDGGSGKDRHSDDTPSAEGRCYDLRSLEWDNKTTLVLSNTRELDRVPSTE